MRKIAYHFILLQILLITVHSHAQNITEDSLYKVAFKNIYDNPDESITIGKTLLKKEKNAENKVTIHLLIANAYVSKRNFDESLKYILNAKEMQNEIKDPMKKITLLTAIAYQYQQMELFDKSLETLDQIDQQLEEYNEDEKRKYSGMGKSYAIRGMIYKNQYNPKIALEKFLIAIKYLEKAKQAKSTSKENENIMNERINNNMSVIHYNIGGSYVDLKMYQKARENYLKSDEYAERAKAKNLKAYSLKGLAETSTLYGNHAEAIKLLETALVYSKDVSDMVLSERIYKGLADNYLALNQPEKYQECNEKYQEIQFEREQSELRSINRAINSYNEDNKKKNKETQKTYKFRNYIILISGIIIAGVFIFLLISRILKNRKLERKIRNILDN